MPRPWGRRGRPPLPKARWVLVCRACGASIDVHARAVLDPAASKCLRCGARMELCDTKSAIDEPEREAG